MQWNALWINASLATCEADNGFLTQAAIACQDGKLVWVGLMQDLPAPPEKLAEHVIDVAGRLITPGLIDCHTHLVYAGNRAHEFEQRLQGVSYEAIAKQGGGIQSTVAATRAASEDELYAQSLPRAKQLLASGVTTLEIKSGYGLDWDTEAKMLRVAQRIGVALPLTVKTTFLGAHTIPNEYKDKPDQYVDLVCHKMMPRVAAENLADAVDVFCERIAFTLPQAQQVFAAAKKHGLAIKCHAEQLSDSGCAKNAAALGALSVDHLEFLPADDAALLAQAGTVAVLLPGAYYFLREDTLPPIAALRKHNVPMAIASDCNPGTSPVQSLPLMMNMACTLFRLTPEEALLGVTKHAAQALGLTTCGRLVEGAAADLAIWDVTHPAELAYSIGGNLLYSLVKAGTIV